MKEKKSKTKKRTKRKSIKTIFTLKKIKAFLVWFNCIFTSKKADLIGEKIVKFLCFLILDFSGIRFIWSKILPPKETAKINRKPSTFILWIFGIYVAVFGITSQRYENRIDIIENRANSIFTQLSTPAYKKALSRIARVQNMSCPKKPYILKPGIVFSSLIGHEGQYDVMVEHLKETVEDWKDKLEGVDLTGAQLHAAKLRDADLQGADLRGALLSGADLLYANLRRAVLVEADLQMANLSGADLQGAYLELANLREAFLSGAFLSGAFLSGADLRDADLKNAKGLTVG